MHIRIYNSDEFKQNLLWTTPHRSSCENTHLQFPRRQNCPHRFYPIVRSDMQSSELDQIIRILSTMLTSAQCHAIECDANDAEYIMMMTMLTMMHSTYSWLNRNRKTHPHALSTMLIGSTTRELRQPNTSGCTRWAMAGWIDG